MVALTQQMRANPGWPCACNCRELPIKTHLALSLARARTTNERHTRRTSWTRARATSFALRVCDMGWQTNGVCSRDLISRYYSNHKANSRDSTSQVSYIHQWCVRWWTRGAVEKPPPPITATLIIRQLSTKRTPRGTRLMTTRGGNCARRCKWRQARARARGTSHTNTKFVNYGAVDIAPARVEWIGL